MEAAGVEPKLGRTAKGICRGLPNVYWISANLRSSFWAFIQQLKNISSDIRLEAKIRLIILKLRHTAPANTIDIKKDVGQDIIGPIMCK